MTEHSQRSRSLSGRLSALAPAARLPRWSAAVRHALQRERHGLAVDENHPVVASRDDLGEVTLHDGIFMPVVRQGLEYHIAILVALLEDEYGAPAHAVQRFADGFAVLLEKFAHVMHVARDQRGRAAFREPGRIDLLVHVPKAPGVVADQGPLPARALQDVGAVDVLGVERRVLAHQDDVVIAESCGHALAAREPPFRIVHDLERREPSAGNAVPQPQVAQLGVVYLPPPRLGRQQDRERRVLGGIDALDRVHHHEQSNSGRHLDNLQGFRYLGNRSAVYRKRPLYRPV